MTEPVVIAWADQFGALIRDKVRKMQDGLQATGWDSMAHVFEDPYDEDRYKLVYEKGDYYLINLQDEDGMVIVLDLEALGVPR